VKVPVIASGGAGSTEHIVEALTTGRASAALLASLLHFGIVALPDLKAALANAGVPIRPPSPAPTPTEVAAWLA
jgi:imidazole glycerol-phosphate synthase subunit HisF